MANYNKNITLKDVIITTNGWDYTGWEYYGFQISKNQGSTVTVKSFQNIAVTSAIVLTSPVFGVDDVNIEVFDTLKYISINTPMLYLDSDDNLFLMYKGRLNSGGSMIKNKFISDNKLTITLWGSVDALDDVVTLDMTLFGFDSESNEVCDAFKSNIYPTIRLDVF
jgi:hypothetical protein